LKVRLVRLEQLAYRESTELQELQVSKEILARLAQQEFKAMSDQLELLELLVMSARQEPQVPLG
jgi:hypothetical protein